jgi:hypothetical protein
LSWHIAAVNVFPSWLHAAAPLIMKSPAHVGWQVVPAANVSEQSPFAPLVGAAEESQVITWQAG